MDPSQIDIICVQDRNGLNLGSFFIRNSETMQLFVDLWSDPILVNFAETHWLLKEQDLFLHLIFEHPKLRKRIGWVHQSVFNAYANGNEGEVWQPGDLVVHFPDCSYRPSV
jgi:galactosyl transferase GMA12/MNN10 family